MKDNKNLKQIIRALSLMRLFPNTMRLAIYACSVFALGFSLSAQVLYWAPDADTAVNGGGVWSTTETAWTANDTDREAWTDGRSAIIGRRANANNTISTTPLTPAGDYTLTIDGSITAQQIRQVSGTGLDTSNYTLSGGTINLGDGGGSAGFRVDHGTFTINSNVVYTGSNTQRLDVAGGNLFLGGNNNVTTWLLRAGSTARGTTIQSSGALGGSGSALFDTDSFLDLNGFNVGSNRNFGFQDGRRVGIIRNSSTSAVTIEGNITTLANNQQTGSRRLEIDGPGVIRLVGDLTGGTDAGAEEFRVVSGGKFIMDGDGSGFTGVFNVFAGGFVGGDGSLGSNLTLQSGAGLLFDPDSTLTVAGIVNVNNLAITDLLGTDGFAVDWSSVSLGTYTLIEGIVGGTLLHDVDNQFDLGGGRQAYFSLGNLELVVIPEPSSFVLLMGITGVFMLIRRRRLS
jgi:hypothetical protein